MVGQGSLPLLHREARAFFVRQQARFFVRSTTTWSTDGRNGWPLEFTIEFSHPGRRMGDGEGSVGMEGWERAPTPPLSLPETEGETQPPVGFPAPIQTGRKEDRWGRRRNHPILEGGPAAALVGIRSRPNFGGEKGGSKPIPGCGCRRGESTASAPIDPSLRSCPQQSSLAFGPDLPCRVEADAPPTPSLPPRHSPPIGLGSPRSSNRFVVLRPKGFGFPSEPAPGRVQKGSPIGGNLLCGGGAPRRCARDGRRRRPRATPWRWRSCSSTPSRPVPRPTHVREALRPTPRKPGAWRHGRTAHLPPKHGPKDPSAGTTPAAPSEPSRSFLSGRSSDPTRVA